MVGTHRDRDVDLALLGEFHRVAGQVGQDLTHAQRIAPQQHRHFGRTRNHQFQVLLRGAYPDQGRHVVEHIVQTEDQAFQFQSGGFDLGQVQNVVDDAEQVLGGRFQLGQVVALRGGQAGVFQQMSHAHHRVHGRADLMAHGGQEGALGLIADLGALPLGSPDQQHQHDGRKHTEQGGGQHSPTEREHLGLVRGGHLLAQSGHARLQALDEGGHLVGGRAVHAPHATVHLAIAERIVGVELGHRRSVALAQSAQFSQQAINRPCFARLAPVQVGE